MTMDAGGKSPESGADEGCMRLLKRLKTEEILEVLSQGFCQHCESLLESRIHSILNKKVEELPLSNDSAEASTVSLSEKASHMYSPENNLESSTRRPYQLGSSSWSSSRVPASVYSDRQKNYNANYSPASVNSKQKSFTHLDPEIKLNDGLTEVSSVADNRLSEDQKERIRFSQVGREKDFVYMEMINGKTTNVLKGLELHTRVFNAEEQKNIVECVYNLQRMGQKGHLRERTYSEPRKWMRGKGRVTIQFGCCYNYAVDKDGNPPGIVRDEEVDPLPHLFKQMIKRMVRWHILPPKCVPNSCIVNIYDEGDCIPPHIDHHDFLRPFCTASFLTECNILFGSSLKIVGPGEFSGPVSIPLPVGSVLILNGNGADIAKHCVPGVSGKRISITFRTMDDSKLPYKFSHDPDMLGIRPLVFSPLSDALLQQNQRHNNPPVVSPFAKSQGLHSQHRSDEPAEDAAETGNDMNQNSFFMQQGDFPPLGSTNNLHQSRSR
ncbi:2OG-FeII_Oxy_2 domain-containing protein [Cephalotus follicularis]|uniref:2OG-FeII_Oxy_2 domain-containing protein n=1 Tax=Cephalotus follicularis TaxID=3775 RepID=A0A1Q3B051_CEPFO|nr:2OG-FeII_Oxy_2 domain-containing protein [Cephalotus follicularis]